VDRGVHHLLLCFRPGGCRGRSIEVAFAVVLAVGVELAAIFYGNKTGLRCSACPSNLLHAFSNNARAQRLLVLQQIGGGSWPWARSPY
jgi:hypothetical protein